MVLYVYCNMYIIIIIVSTVTYCIYYEVYIDIVRLAVGTNKGLAVIDTENNTVLHILSSLTSLLCKCIHV